MADSFEKGTELLRETAGIRLSESTVERTTEATGERIAEHLRAGRTFGGQSAWSWFRDARGRTVGSVSIDATGVRQQGPHAVCHVRALYRSERSQWTAFWQRSTAA